MQFLVKKSYASTMDSTIASTVTVTMRESFRQECSLIGISANTKCALPAVNSWTVLNTHQCWMLTLSTRPCTCISLSWRRPKWVTDSYSNLPALYLVLFTNWCCISNCFQLLRKQCKHLKNFLFTCKDKDVNEQFKKRYSAYVEIFM